MSDTPGRAPRSTLSQRLLTTLVIAGLVVTVHAAAVLQSIHGAAIGNKLGVVARAGDLNNDGTGDWIAGEPSDDSGRGLVRVFSGVDQTLLLLLQGDLPGQRFGSSVGALGDVDGDGHDDVVIGAPASGIAGGMGSVSVHSGRDGSLLFSVSDDEAESGYGFAVSGVGDLNGDGTPDLAVGAPYRDSNGPDAGSVFFLDGTNGTTIQQLNGSAAYENFGHSVSGPVLSDADGGIIIGAKNGGESFRGVARVYDRSTLTLDHSFMGSQAFDRLGHEVCVAGDVNNDGVTDFITGTDPRDDSGKPTGPGYVRVYSGTDGTLLHQVAGALGEGFGMHVAGVGDLNQDGHDDFAIGTPYADCNGVDSGMVETYSGLNGVVLHRVSGSSAGDHFGSSLAGLGDVNNDGENDVAIAAPSSDIAGEDAGTVLVLSLARWQTLSTGVAGTAGLVPELDGDGDLAPETTVELRLTDAMPNAAVTLVLGYSAYVDSATGDLVPVPDSVTAGLTTDASGSLTQSHTWPSGTSTGLVVYYSFLVSDAGADSGVARSNTVTNYSEEPLP
jgi:hypothetical protein